MAGEQGGGVSDARPNIWIKPGWYVAICEGCKPLCAVPYHDRAERDARAAEHAAESGHFVTLMDGATTSAITNQQDGKFSQ